MRNSLLLLSVTIITVGCGASFKGSSTADRNYPSYCDSVQYANTMACAGAYPSYCASPDYGNTYACLPVTRR